MIIIQYQNTKSKQIRIRKSRAINRDFFVAPILAHSIGTCAIFAGLEPPIRNSITKFSSRVSHQGRFGSQLNSIRLVTQKQKKCLKTGGKVNW